MIEFVKNKLNEENRVIVAKVEIEGLSNPLISELQKITLKNGFCGRQYLTIGQTNSKYIDVTFYSEENLSLKSKKVTLSFGVKNGTTVEYTKMGNFKITEYDKEGNIYTFTAYDEMSYLYGATVYTVDSAKNTPKLILDGIASDFDTTYRIDGFSGLTSYALQAELDSSYDIVNNNIGKTSVSVDSLQETVNEHSTSISNIKSRLDTQSNTISTLNSTVDTHGTNISKLTTDLESLEEMNDNNTVYAYGYVGNSNCNALIPCRLIMQKSSPNKANVHMTGYIQSITGNSEFYVFELSIITGLLGLSSLTIDAKKTTVVLDQHLCENPSLIQAYMGYGLTFDGWTIGRIYDYDGSSGGWPSNAPVHQAGTYFIIDIYDATYS